MRIGIIGTGYVGLITGACLSKNHKVICNDININHIHNLKNNILPFYEPNLDTLLVNNNNIEFTNNLKYTIENSDCCILTVNTPRNEDGSPNIQNLLFAIDDMMQYIQKDYFIIIKSTIPIGVTKKLNEKFNNLEYNVNFIFNPEFLSEGSGVINFLNQDRTIIGSEDKKSIKIIKEIYKGINTTFYIMDSNSAELVKLASNCFLALKISFINEIANICDKCNANINYVKKGIGADKRINSHFLNEGIGYGGSCFKKDIDNLVNYSITNGYNPFIINKINLINENQINLVIDKIYSDFNFNLQDKTISIWGLSFKPNTSDIREAPSIKIINKLLEKGVRLNVNDPQALENTYNLFGDKLNYFDDKYEALKNTDGLIITTEWEEYINSDIGKIMENTNNIYDCRNIFNKIEGINHCKIGDGFL